MNSIRLPLVTILSVPLVTVCSRYFLHVKRISLPCLFAATLLQELLILDLLQGNEHESAFRISYSG